jgi:chromosomal replication initiation ATPase DnaA
MNADFSFEGQERAVIKVENLFFRDSIESKFLRDIEAAIKTVRPSTNSIQIEVK